MVRRKANISGGEKTIRPETTETRTQASDGEHVRTFLGRTPLSWAKILTFYVIFYLCLLGFSCLNYYIFSSIILVENEPTLKLTNGLIGDSPGVGFRPLPDEDSAQSLIWIDSQDGQQAKVWYKQLSKYVRDANMTGASYCNYSNPMADKQACQVDLRDLDKGDCNEENKFGYTKSKPCILIKLNRIYEWKPLPYGLNEKGEFIRDKLTSDLKAIAMPDELQSYIFETIENSTDYANRILSSVWISCDSRGGLDKERLKNKTSYFPGQMIPGYYFPYKNQQDYRSPFVMVQFDLSDSKGKSVDIECRAWAKNIKYDKSENLGFVRFQILI